MPTPRPRTAVTASLLLALTSGLPPACGTAEPNPSPSDADDASAAGLVDIERAFPNLRFERPVFVTGAGDGSGRLFVVEQDGVVRMITPAASGREEDVRQAPVFLDLRDVVSRRGNEEGLLGLAFHPRRQRELFVFYSSIEMAGEGEPAADVISRFAVHDDRQSVDRGNEEVLLTVPQPYRNHNGGMLAFGPDGYLYASFGDGGAANDPHGNGQDLSTLLGSIVRIDVDPDDPDEPYAIPADNPFVDVPGARPELWAVGLRNVWRFSFDRADGTLFAADIGQNRFEEVDIVERGSNHGWNRYEAHETFREETTLSVGEHVAPVAVYGRGEGLSITGGYAYRGRRHPGWWGDYFYGDYVSGQLWRLRRGADGGQRSELVRRTGRSIASFGEDDDGELYLTSFDGGLYRLVPGEHAADALSDWPERLSETGLYASTADRELADDVQVYSVNAPFWSDGASKRRAFRLPAGARLGYREQGAWDVPVGATLVKTFDVPRSPDREGRERPPRPLETRLIRHGERGWEAATYVWDGDGRDATLRPAGQQFELRSGRRVDSWHAPSAAECASCHVESAGFVLGLTTAQLQREVDGRFQIAAWHAAGLLADGDAFDPVAAGAFPDPHGDADLGLRARTWLDVNCAMCHRPDGPGNATLDLRAHTPLAHSGLLDTPAVLAAGADEGAPRLLLDPGAPERSELLRRIETLGPGRMPPIGSNRVDEDGAALLRAWIASLP